MVLNEEHQPKCNNSTCTGSRSSKKNKSKKIPQRGLGVAQLEKLRIEEQQQKQNNNPTSSSPSNPSHSLVVLPLPSLPRQPSLPFLTPRGDTNTLIRSAINSSSSAVDFFKPEQIGFSTRNAENFGGNQHHYMSPPFQLMNNKATCIPILSGVNLQIEPPSNQNYNSNYCFMNSSRREEERIAGLNLPWPETAMPFSYKSVPHFDTPFLKPEESLSMYGKSPQKIEYKSTAGFSKEGGSGSNSYQVDWRNSEVHTNKRLRENVTSQDSAFLTLGSSATQSTSRMKKPMEILPEYSFLQSQVGEDNDVKQYANSPRKPFYSFLPMKLTAHELDANTERDGAVDSVDTNLKL